MAQFKVRNSQGKDAGTVELSDAVFGVELNESAIRQTLIAYEANQRQGTHSTKTRAFVSGGGRKPWKQKGTGRARQGSIRSPQWRGGAIIFGPQPRDYRQKVNKKTRRLALQSALTDLGRQNRITVIDTFGFSEPKTKEFIGLLERLEVPAAKRVLVLLPGDDTSVRKSAQNLPNVLVGSTQSLNIYDLLTCDTLVTTKDGIKSLEEQFA